MLVLAIVICFMLPVYIAFEPPFSHTSGWHNFEIIVEVIFGIDVIFKFNTTLYDTDGNEIFDRKHIAIDYLSESHFWIDMAATIPFNKMMDNAAAKLAPTLKVIRIIALSKIVEKLSIRDDTKAVIFLFFIFPLNSFLNIVNQSLCFGLLFDHLHSFEGMYLVLYLQRFSHLVASDLLGIPRRI